MAPPFALPFLQPSLAFSLIYIWSRKNPHEQVALFWIIQLPAPYVRLGGLLFEKLSDNIIASCCNDCNIGDIGWQYAVARRGHRGMHCRAHRMVPDGSMAFRDE